MTNREILGELKSAYEYLYDIRENGCIDHCDGQIKQDLINKLEVAKSNIEDIYSGFYNTLDKEELRVKKLEENEDEQIYISSDISCGYDIYDFSAGEKDWFTCEDVDYFWYEDREYLDGDV